jgi:AraC-like DNA-binding protein
MAEVRCLFAFEHRVPGTHTCVRHRHACTEIVFNIGGEGTLFHGSESFEYGPASVFTYQPGQEHWVTQRRRGAHLCFGIEGCGAADIRVGSFPAGKHLQPLIANARELVAARSANSRSRIELLAGLIALDLSERFPRRATQSLAQKARACIDRRYHEPLTVAAVAEQLFISPDYLRQVFRREFGEGPLHYLLRKRIEAAIELLRFSTLPVQDVARQCGFDNPFYFSRLFRKMSGKTPSAVRMQLSGDRRKRL